MAASIAPYVEHAAHVERILGPVGMFECEVGGVVRPKAAPGSGHARHAGFPSRPRHQFVVQHLVVPVVVFGALGRMNAPVVPRQRVETVGAVDFHQTVFHEPPHRLDQALVAVLVKAPARGREQDDRIAPLPEHQHFHVAAQVGRMPFAVFLSHWFLVLSGFCLWPPFTENGRIKIVSLKRAKPARWLPAFFRFPPLAGHGFYNRVNISTFTGKNT